MEAQSIESIQLLLAQMVDILEFLRSSRSIEHKEMALAQLHIPQFQVNIDKESLEELRIIESIQLG